MKKMNRALAFAALFLLPALGHADADLPEGCLKAYEGSTDAGVLAAKEFIEDSISDFDYPSIDDMSASIRAKIGLPAWTKKDYLDDLNVAVTRSLEQVANKVCAKKPLNLDQMRELLIKEALPKYFKANPDDAKSIGWK